MRIFFNLLIFNFVLCDLVILIISIFFDLVLEENDYVWLFGGVFCKIFWFLVIFLVMLVLFILVFILLDCY